MRRMKLKSVMIAIAVLAVLMGTWIGLDRRSRRLQALALDYGRKANRAENALESASPSALDSLLDQIHRDDAIANAYRTAASRPWLPVDPDPNRIACRCGFHEARKAKPSR